MKTKKKESPHKTGKISPQKKLIAEIVDLAGAKVKSISLPEGIFSHKVSDKLLSQYVRVYLSKRRKGLAQAKTRGEVTGSTAKIYRQKGTGRARHGDRQAPIFVGGGKAHGPRLRDHSLKLNKKQRRKALFSALTHKYESQNVFFVNGFLNMEPKTKKMKEALGKIHIDDNVKVLFVYGKAGKNASLAVRNLTRVSSVEVGSLNAYAVLNADKIVFSDETLEQLKKMSTTEVK